MMSDDPRSIPVPSLDHIEFVDTPKALREDILTRLFCQLGKFPAVANRNDWYLALALTVRDRLMRRWTTTARTYFQLGSRTVVYLSAEFLLGPHLGNNLLYLGITEAAREAVAGLGLDLDDLLDQEEEPGLGNGGLGRLAACYMDSLATLQIPAIGYGIRYEFGIFDQVIRGGEQVEITDKWLRLGNPWEIAHPELGFPVKLGGRTEAFTDSAGRWGVRWLPDRVVVGTPCDTPILGYGVANANLLRLWKAEASESFDFGAFNAGDYYRAVHDKVASENLTKVLYPNDEPAAGKQLRLEQQYFFVSCSLQDMLRIFVQRGASLDRFHEKWTVQLNDTHPAIAVAELMRLLVDEHGLDWERAWSITTQTFAYTNHTLLPEALETWPVPLFASTLPRHLEIIHEINRRFLDEVRLARPGDDERAAAVSLIAEGEPKRVRMANLACVGSHAINGVAALHSELLKATVLRPFSELWPDKFTNVTNGVTPRRFLRLANPGLAGLLDEAIGTGWTRDLAELGGLEALADDAGFRRRWRAIALANKSVLAAAVRRATGAVIDPATLFDIHVKRIHEYKRQHLNALGMLTAYLRLRDNPGRDDVPSRTWLVAGKAAPGYVMAKLIIRLITAIADSIDRDPLVRDRLRVVFYPDFNVKNAQPIYPAADLSEQISTAGYEASGTGNMKFMMNGAITIGTLDGANIEIRDAVGAEHFALFGLTAKEVRATKNAGYRPRDIVAADPELHAVIDFIASGALAGGDRERFSPLVTSLLDRDEFLVLADYRSYIQAQEQVGRWFAEPEAWTRSSIFNVARSGFFSSDRAIREYAERIWHVSPVEVDLGV